MQQNPNNLTLIVMKKTFPNASIPSLFLFSIIFLVTSFHHVYSQTLVKDLYTGKFGSNPGYIGEVNNGFIFYASSVQTGDELWFSDGTNSGTKLVKDIYPGPTGSRFNTFFVKIKSNWFFVAKLAGFQWSLWKTDGTESGTIKLIDLGSIPTSGFSQILMAANGDYLFFTFDDPFDGKELWKSDGTVSGTKRVKDINPSAGSDPTGFTSFNNKMYFFADDGINGLELWNSDGTDTGTKLVKDIYPGGVGSINNSFPSLMVFKNKLYFGAQGEHDEGIELYVTDGTMKGTTLFLDINKGLGASSYPALLLATGTKLFFRANDGINGAEPWISDGTISGTKLLKDIYLGPDGSLAATASEIGNNIVFNAQSLASGNEPYITDGTTNGTKILKEINKGKLNSYTSTKVNIGNKWYFTATDSLTGTELWETNGTEAGTIIQKDFNPGSSGSNILSLFAYKSELYFSATITKDSLGSELYKYKPSSTGIVANKMNETNFTVYPNPINTGQILNINSKFNELLSMSIMTMDGKSLISNRFNASSLNNTIPISLNPGFYILRLESKDLTTNFKLIVEN
jgi:ELWxxDGT repeat protein